MEVKKGDLYFIRYYNNDRKRGRPAVVVSGDKVNASRDTVTIAYLSSVPFNGAITKTQAKLTSSGRPSIAILECVVSVGKNRLGDYMGHISLEEGAAIDSALCVAFDL